jgi:hypothetical protein
VSGVLVLADTMMPVIVNVSEGIDAVGGINPTIFCKAFDGQPCDMQPTPEFWSQ